MKKYFSIFLLLLLLCGCSNQEPDQPQGTTVPLVTLPPAYYDENSTLESQTNGAIRQYSLPESGYSDILCTGNGLVVVSESGKIQMLTGDTCIPTASFELPCKKVSQLTGLSNGVAYYDEDNFTIQFLDLNLMKKHSVVLTDEMSSPIISPDGTQIYYCYGQEIRALDVEKNISRLVKVQSAEKQHLLYTCFDGSVIGCAVTDKDGIENTLYLSASDGQNLDSESGIINLYTFGNRFLAYWRDGVVEQWVSGSADGKAVRFLPQEDKVYGAPMLGGAVGYSETEEGLCLSYYDLSAGMMTAQVILPRVEEPDILCEDSASGCIWLITSTSNNSGKVLLRWNPNDSVIQEQTVCTDVFYTPENPDTTALKELKSRADKMGTQYGVEIRIWQDAVATAGDLTLMPEHQVAAIQNMLDQLESVLQEFPKDFINKSIRTRLKISLVRSVNGTTIGQQYWVGRNAYIALCSASDIREDFLKAFGLVVDSHVLGNSPVYDYWDTLNPSGFQYGNYNEALLTDEDPSFVDADSMISGMYDRSRVFWQAMEPDNAERFKTETMQKKLEMLCKAIRDAWGLKKKADVYPWEQYLESPIAYKK